MGTNYFAFTRNKELARKHFRKTEWEPEYELVDEPDFGYEIHLGKRAGGWKPLFQAHENAYKGVNEMLKFFKDHAGDFEFYDEYSEKMTLDQIKEELVDWGNVSPDKVQHCRKFFNGRCYDLETVGPGEPWDITTPFSHIQYLKLMRDPYAGKYWEDEDGYDFTEGDFA